MLTSRRKRLIGQARSLVDPAGQEMRLGKPRVPLNALDSEGAIGALEDPESLVDSTRGDVSEGEPESGRLEPGARGQAALEVNRPFQRADGSGRIASNDV